MRQPGIFRNKRLSAAATAAGSAVFSCVIIAFFIMVLAYIVSKIDAADMMLSTMSAIALCAGSFSGGYVSGRKKRRNGLFMGVLSGIFVFVIIVLLSHFFSKAVESFSVSTKLFLTLGFAGIGGVVGVNSKKGRFQPVSTEFSVFVHIKLINKFVIYDIIKKIIIGGYYYEAYQNNK